MATGESIMETENLIEPNVQQLDVEVCVKNEQEMKVGNPVEPYGLYTDMCVKTEQETDHENPVDLYVQQHGDATIETDIKTKSEPDVLLHPQFHGVNIKREEEIKADISSEASSQEMQSEELCHVHKSGVDCEMGEDESAETGSQMTNEVDTGQIAPDSRNSGTDDPRRSNMRAQVWGLLEKYGYANASADTESAAIEIVERLMNDTLESPDQLCCILGIDPSTQTDDVNTADNQDPPTDEEAEPELEIDVADSHSVGDLNTADNQDPPTDEEAEPELEIDVADSHSVGDLNTADNQDPPTDEEAEPELEIDVADSHSVGDAFPCLECNTAFPTEELLEHHSAWLHHDESWRKTREMSGVSSHSRDGEKPTTDKINILKGGEVEMARKDKCVKESIRDPSRTCTVCSKSFGKRDRLLKHMRTIHDQKKGSEFEEDKPYKCTICSKSYGKNSHLLAHIRFVHDGEKPYKCSVCGKAFPQKSDMLKHIRTIHEGDKPYKCSVCGKAFGQKASMLRHIKIIHEGNKPYKCTVCGKSYGRNFDLLTHIRFVHDGEEPSKCSVCGKAFRNKSYMLTHIRTIHDKDKPYKCTVCDKPFGTNSNLLKHIRLIHEGEKPYKCSVCGKAFGEKKDMLKHIRALHEALTS